MAATGEHAGAVERDGSWIWDLLDRRRAIVQPTADAIAWAVAIVVATLLRYDVHPHLADWAGVAVAVPLTAGLQTAVGFASGLYTGRWRFGSFDEVFAVVRAVAITTCLLFLVNPFVGGQLVPRSVPLAAGLISLVLASGTRYAWRLVLERRLRASGEGRQRLLVFGAGAGAERVIPALLRDNKTRFVPVALLDDDPAKRKLSIMGIKVVGNRSALKEAAAAHQANALLIAIPSAGSGLVTDLTELATEAGLKAVKVLPSLSELFDDRVGPADIRDVTPADLLGRHEIKTDLESIAGYLTGRTIMVTGAGGSIGSELCRQIDSFAPKQLIMVDRDESALHAVQLSIEGRALLDSPDLVLLDLRDRPSVERLLHERRPDVIFHAAALKHLPLLERHPAEAVKSNVWVTADLLEAAVAAGVERFVNISTDKAAEPCSVLGYSKRIAERLTAHYAARGTTNCLSVRFGNVIGSRGSVLTSFQAQIQRGGPITVTHPDVTRYFMTVEEAVQLVIQAGAIGSPGEVLVLDMGEPVRIADVATLLARRSERHIAIQFTGLRAGEKLHEILLERGAVDRRPVHPLISHVTAPPLDPSVARDIDASAPDDVLVPRLRELCGHQPRPVVDTRLGG